MFHIKLVTLQGAGLTPKCHFGPYSTSVSLHSSHLRAIFPIFHFFTVKNVFLSLFALVTRIAVSPLKIDVSVNQILNNNEISKRNNSITSPINVQMKEKRDVVTTEFYHSWNRNIVPNSPESWEALTR